MLNGNGWGKVALGRTGSVPRGAGLKIIYN